MAWVIQQLREATPFLLVGWSFSGGSLRVKLKENCRCPGQPAVVPGFESGISDRSAGLCSVLSPLEVLCSDRTNLRNRRKILISVEKNDPVFNSQLGDTAVDRAVHRFSQPA